MRYEQNIQEATISVLLASDFPVLRDGVTQLLGNSPDVQVVACAEAENEVLALADTHKPLVAVLDLNIEPAALVDLIGELSSRKVAPLLLSDAVDDSRAIELVKRGARGIITRRASPEMLCKSVRAVALGETWISRRVTNKLVHMFQFGSQSEWSQAVSGVVAPVPVAMAAAAPMQARPQENRFGLTRRERQIVEALSEGMANKDIASHYSISECTVKHHLTRIFDKVGVYSRLELLVFAKHHGLVVTTHPAA
jgi:DNA-binding NarL/FixJ family response regulator